MKKIILCLMLFFTIMLTGCGKISKEKLKSNFINDVSNLNGYYMTGELSINNNDDVYLYDVDVSYSKSDYFKVILTNKNNNYEQIILRNNDGVYVINKSLNKSFKFQSEWPYNNSQSYLLQSIANDLKQDESYEFEENNGDYIFKVKVSYPNNRDIVKEKVYLNKNGDLKLVEVLDNNDIPRITFKVNNLDKKSVFKDDYFNIDSIISKDNNESTTKETTNNKETKDITKEKTDDMTKNNNVNTNKEEEEPRTTAKIEDTLFPLYLPKNTSLSNKEVISTNVGERVIMTFQGDNSFILVQENVAKEDEFTVVPSYGEPYLLIDTVGALTDTSYTWISNGIEYYIVSDVMSTDELLEVAKSINVVATISEK